MPKWHHTLPFSNINFCIMGPTIFISIASYMDPMLMFTLEQVFNKAKYPVCIFVGIVDQHVENHREEITKFPFAENIRYVHLKPQDTHGVSWARSIAFSLYNNENFLLQIDSHTVFEQDWDEILMSQYWEMLGRSPKPILTTYPDPFSMHDGIPQYNNSVKDSGKVSVLRPMDGEVLLEDNLLLGFIATYVDSKDPVVGCHVAGGFLFTSGSFISEIPYDPFLYFHGEEQSLAIRAYTRGWDIYHPRIVPLRHLYKQSGVEYDSQHWHAEINKQRDHDYQYLITRSLNRMNALLSGKGSLGIYGLGHLRSLDDFAEISGIDYKHLTVVDPPIKN